MASKESTKRLYTQPPRSSFSKRLVFDGSDPNLRLLSCDVKGGPLMEDNTRIKGRLASPSGGEVKQLYVDQTDGWTGSVSECGKVYEFNGHRVALEEAELVALRGNDDHTIRIERFVDEDEFDPMFVEKTHLLWWAEDRDVQQYDLLLSLLAHTGKCFIGTTVQNGSTRAVVIRYSAMTETLVAHVCRYAENVRWPHIKTVREGVMQRTLPTAEDVQQIAGIFDALSHDPTLNVEDDFGQRLEAALIQKIETGESTVTAPTGPQSIEDVPDLMAALKASVGEAKKPASRSRKAAKVA